LHSGACAFVGNEYSKSKVGDCMKKEFSMKLFWIGLLGLFLFIPLVLIQNLADERKQRRESVSAQLGRVWGGAQLIALPFISKEQTVVVDAMTFSSEVEIKGKQTVEIRKKGTYKIPFYSLDLTITGKALLPSKKSEIYYLVLPVASIAKVTIESASYNDKLLKQIKNDSRLIAFQINTNSQEKEISYKIQMKLTGMEKFHLLPLAEKVRLELESNWADPSFTGIALPDERSVGANGYKAVWNFKNQENLYQKTHLFNMMEESAEFVNLQDEIFGVSLILAVDGYHLINRVVKYGFLFIGLTFAGFFVFEAIYSLRVHLIQYVFVGFALLLFYLLLLSFSEYIGFAFAYLVAAFAVLAQIYSYAIVVLRSKNRAFVLGTGISALYGFLYILINLEEYSLVTGSIALFLLLSAIMYFTRNVDWYSLFGNSEKGENAS
jgi:inner membrane protein